MGQRRRPILKSVKSKLLGEYEIWTVYRVALPHPPVTVPKGLRIEALQYEDLVSSSDQGMRSRANFAGQEAQGYGVFEGELLVASQWYWWGNRYLTSQRLSGWRLPVDAAKSVDLYTLPEFRGRGIATLLKMQSAHLMSLRNFEALYSRIWHSHSESRQVSEKAGWKKCGWYISISPLGKKIVLSLPRSGRE